MIHLTLSIYICIHYSIKFIIYVVYTTTQMGAVVQWKIQMCCTACTANNWPVNFHVEDKLIIMNFPHHLFVVWRSVKVNLPGGACGFAHGAGVSLSQVRY